MDDKMHGKKHVHEGRRKGGEARARALAPKTRSEIGRRAAIARWDPSIPEAIFGSPDRLLHLGDIELDCYVLSTEERVFSQRGMMQALALTIRGGELSRFVEQAGLEPHLSDEARQALTQPREFRRRGGGPLVKGYPVTLLVDICTAILDADRKNGLPKHYELSRIRAEIIIRAVAKVGIIALVDEVTGYQDVRHREALQAILDRYLRREFAAWAKRFPDEFYKELFRLRGWEWEGPGKSGHAVAHSTNDLVYARIAPELLTQLQRVNPRENNRRRTKHHQWLTDDIGLPALERHLYAVTGLMRAADSWQDFKRMVDRALPLKDPYVDLPLFEYDRETDADG